MALHWTDKTLKMVTPQLFGAKGDGVTDDKTAFDNMFNFAINNGVTIKIPNATYIVSAKLEYDCLNKPLSVVGEGLTTIKATHTTESILRLRYVNGGIIDNLSIVGSATVRDSSNYGLRLDGCSELLITNIKIDSCAAAGIMCYTLKKSKITNCIVKNNLADGIHLTSGCEDVAVNNNHMENTGDDGVAVVSYSTNLNYCTNIIISNNVIKNSKTRGITHIGGNNVIIKNNLIDGTASSGILVVKDSTYGTKESNNTTISGNQIYNVGSVNPNKGNQYGIETDVNANNVIVSENLIVNTKGRGVNILGDGFIFINNKITGGSFSQFSNSVGAIIKGNIFEGASQAGAAFVSLVNTSIEGNIFYNNALSGGSYDNALLTNCSKISLTKNLSIDDRTTKLIERTFEFVNCTDIDFIDNKEDATGKVVAFGTSTAIKVSGVLTGTVAPVMSRYKVGTQYLNTTNNDFYVYNGTNWVKTPMA